MKNKKIILNYSSTNKLWVGNGFHVHPLIRPTEDLYKHTDPFILMDYAAPTSFKATDQKLGVGPHPHKGFETVTFALQGEVEHKDSAGGQGIIRQGGVQWMTAGKGLVHEEFHSREFAKKGGVFEMVQLWVNLPKKDKLTLARYQDMQVEEFPVVVKDKLHIKVIAGHYEKKKGPTKTFSEMNVFEIAGSGKTSLSFKPETNTIILVTKGRIQVNDNEKKYGDNEMIIFSQDGENIELELREDSHALVLNAVPLNETIVAQGPFVMNTKEEIIEAVNEYNNGQMGTL